MRNKKTTLAGYVVIGAAVLTVAAAWMTDGDVEAAIEMALLPALAGAGLIGAADGSH